MKRCVLKDAENYIPPKTIPKTWRPKKAPKRPKVKKTLRFLIK